MDTICDQMLCLELNLAKQLNSLYFGDKVKYIYNPLDYAFELHKMFVERYCRTKKKLLFLGMNPGPWGMMQNGVSFGDVNAVRDYLQIFGDVRRPEREHPSRPVLGLACNRSEVSGKRFWSLASSLSDGNADNFFTNCFIYNYFPFCLLNENGKNITPPELQREVRQSIETICDETLYQILKVLDTKVIVGVGRFAEKRASLVVQNYNLNIEVEFIPHPSPRNPKSNKDWISSTKQMLLELDLLQYFPI